MKTQEEVSFRHALSDIKEGKKPIGFSSLGTEDLIRITSEAVKSALRDGIRSNNIEMALKQIGKMNDFVDLQISATANTKTLIRHRGLIEKAGIDLVVLVENGAQGKVVKEVITEMGLGEKGQKKVSDVLAKKMKQFEAVSTI